MEHRSLRFWIASTIGALFIAAALIVCAITPRLSLASASGDTNGKGAIVSSQTNAAQAISYDGTAQKQEVIYAKLSSVGNPQSLYAVNTFQSSEGCSISDKTIKDYGEYTQVINLTDGSALKQESDGILFKTEEKSFSYQGNMATTELPWIISFEHCLNGEKVAASDLAGKSGQLELVMTTKKNDAVDATYFDNYVIQATCNLPMDKAENVKTEDGSIALSGSNVAVNFMVLPGKDTTCTLTADINNFEMDSISIAAVPLSMNIGSIDSSGMISNFDQLISGTKALAEGSKSLEQGASQLASGARELDSGIQQLNAQAQTISGGLTEYTSNVNQINSNLTAIIGKIKEQSGSLNAFNEALKNMSPSKKTALETQLGLPSGTLDAIQTSLGEMSTYIGQLDEAEKGLAQLSQAGSDLSSGMEQYAQGMNSLANSSGALVTGTDELSQGASSLASGTSELSTQSQGIPSRIQSEIDAMLSEFDKSDYKPLSFTSSKNTNATLVQFVMTTEAIKAPQPEKVIVEEEELSIVDRFFALFS